MILRASLRRVQKADRDVANLTVVLTVVLDGQCCAGENERHPGHVQSSSLERRPPFRLVELDPHRLMLLQKLGCQGRFPVAEGVAGQLRMEIGTGPLAALVRQLELEREDLG